MKGTEILMTMSNAKSHEALLLVIGSRMLIP